MELVKTIKRGFKATVRKAKAFLTAPRFQMAFMFIFCFVTTVFAQAADPGQTALADVTTNIAKYVPIVCKLCYVIAGIVAILGAISIYLAMNNDDQDIKKKIMLVVGACIFLVAAAQALPKFFGVDTKAGTIDELQ